MSKRVLITGGAGFLGSHLCEALLKQEHEVLCVDNFFTGRRTNIAHLVPDPLFEIARHDITFPLYVEVDEIYNLACPASPIHYQFDPVQTTKTSVHGAINMLGLAKRLKVKILQASTSEVYGDPAIHPQPETYWGNVNCIGARSCFAEDTEILTKEGFKFFKELTMDDEIATLNNKIFLEYHKPYEIIKQRYIGELIEFKNSKIDLHVTPNHTMYARLRDDKGKQDFSLIPAYESINWKRAEMQKSANWVGEEKENFFLPPVKNSKFGNINKIKMDDWLEFFGYYITEGCVHLGKRIRKIKNKDYDTINYNVLIAQDRKNIKERFKINACLKNYLLLILIQMTINLEFLISNWPYTLPNLEKQKTNLYQVSLRTYPQGN